MNDRMDKRPWGFYEVLADRLTHKVKRITIYPGHRLSYQRHSRRSEHWYMVEGRAVVTRDGEDLELPAGRAVDIPAGTWHRIKNTCSGNVVFIEIQTGDYFGEDDIERSEDDYGRTDHICGPPLPLRSFGHGTLGAWTALFSIILSGAGRMKLRQKDLEE